MQADPPRTIAAKLLPTSGLAAIRCPYCESWHTHHAKPGLTRAPCDRERWYRLRISDTASAAEERKIRMMIGRALINATTPQCVCGGALAGPLGGLAPPTHGAVASSGCEEFEGEAPSAS